MSSYYSDALQKTASSRTQKLYVHCIGAASSRQQSCHELNFESKNCSLSPNMLPTSSGVILSQSACIALFLIWGMVPKRDL